MHLLTEHWPFWLGALALAGVSFAFLFAMRALLGVSSSYARLLAWSKVRAREETERSMPDDAQALEAMLIEATLEEFGESARRSSDSQPPSLPKLAPKRAPSSAHLVFLVSIALGGLLSALLSGTFALRWDFGADFSSIFGGGWPAIAVLLGGGVLVGFGTSMAGGCTSGHGLSGCSRLQLGSLAATAIFFGAGIVVSILLAAL